MSVETSVSTSLDDTDEIDKPSGATFKTPDFGLYNKRMLSEYYRSATEGAAVAEKDGFGVVKITGTERISWLQGMITNDVQALKPGQGCYAAHLTPQGKMVAHMQVLVDDDTVWLSLERVSISNVVAAFDKLIIMEDAQITDMSSGYSILNVLGPKSPDVLSAWLGQKLTIGEPYSHRNLGDCRIVVSDLGYDIWVPTGQVDHVLRSFVEHGATAIDHGTWDVLRTEAGIPVYGVDIDETTTMPELGSQGISYDKGCYIGQEVVAKVKYIGHVNRKFVGLILSGKAAPELKSVIRKGGRDVGYITTALFSPKLSKPIALGFISRATGPTGTEVEVGAEKATIVDLPFTGERSGSDR
jgi:folate-binding protein YgfZ